MDQDSKQQAIGNRFWNVFFPFLIFFRMWLTAGDEFIFEMNDTQSFTSLAASYPSPEKNLFPNHLPGMPILCNLVTSFGIPFKLFLDTFLILTAWMTIKSISPLLSSSNHTSSIIIKSLIAGTLLLNPWVICQSRIFMTEPLTSILLLALAASTVSLITTPIRGWRPYFHLLPTLFTTSISLVRPEYFLLLIFWLVLIAILIWFHLGSRTQLEQAKGRILTQLFFLSLPILMPWASLTILRSFHEYRFGVRGAFANEAEGVEALLNALYQIKPQQNIRFAPVPMESIRLACEECPTLKLREKQLLDTSAFNFRFATTHLNLKDEIGTWLNWHLIWAFQGINKESNLEMMQCANEIHQAFAESRLQQRYARFPIDPLYKEWAPDIPYLFYLSLKNSFFPPVYRFRTSPQARGLSLASQADLEDTLLPRKGTVSDPPYYFSATHWVASNGKSSQFEHLMIVDDQGRILGFGTIQQEADRSFVNFKVEAIGYSSADPLFLKFENSNQSIQIPFQLATVNSWKEIGNQNSKEQTAAESWQLECRESGVRFHSRERTQSEIFKYFDRFLYAAISVCLLLGFMNPTDRTRLHHLLLLTTSLAILMGGRCAMYTLLEAWTKWGLERYIGPNHLVTILFAILMAYVLGCFARSLMNHIHCRFQNQKSGLSIEREVR